MIARTFFVGTALLSTMAWAEAPSPDQSSPAPRDNAALFGARPAVIDAHLSPDGSRIVYISPSTGNGSMVVVAPAGQAGQGNVISRASGKPDQFGDCHWVSNARLVCQIHGVEKSASYGILPYTRLIAVDADGSNMKPLRARVNDNSRGLQLWDGEIVDWLPNENGAVLMARTHLPDDHIGSLAGSTKEGLGVDHIDTSTLRATVVEQPKRDAIEYITDGWGTVRIQGSRIYSGTGQFTGVTKYFYRRRGAREWLKLSDTGGSENGFVPYAVDHDRDIAYGLMDKDGRSAFYSVALDGSLAPTLMYARSDVDIDGVKRIGRRGRVVGLTFQTDKREAVYFDPEIKALVASLARALPKQPIVQIVDSSADERKLLIFAGSDTDPGIYYLFNRDTKELHILMAARPELIGRSLGTMKSVSFKANDGTVVPAYLTLPPGKESARGLPAIVMPHGGPADRDEWGFDWLPQFYAAQGYAVLQPEFRGSTGYGDGWYQRNGFRSWRMAVGDVVDAGRWLVREHIADPAKLAIVGWSYGGYAALQSAVIAPDLYKAVVAIAPVTDLGMFRNEFADWDDDSMRKTFVGSGSEVIHDGSPAQNATSIKSPVLLVHGTMDRNVAYAESNFMESRLHTIGKKVELMTFEGLDHQLDDSDARAKMLRESDAFIRASIGG